LRRFGFGIAMTEKLLNRSNVVSGGRTPSLRAGAALLESQNLQRYGQAAEEGTPAAKQLLRSMSYADTQKDCEKQRDGFVSRYQNECPKATQTLMKDWDRRVSF
jgi:hypothetical protein